MVGRRSKTYFPTTSEQASTMAVSVCMVISAHWASEPRASTQLAHDQHVTTYEALCTTIATTRLGDSGTRGHQRGTCE
eukprot:8245351-Heterocapsa_arctica.AAC.1